MIIIMALMLMGCGVSQNLVPVVQTNTIVKNYSNVTTVTITNQILLVSNLTVTVSNQPGLESWTYTIRSADVYPLTYDGYSYYEIDINDDRLDADSYMIEVRQYNSAGTICSQLIPYWSDLTWAWYNQVWIGAGYLYYYSAINPTGYRLQFYRIRL